MAGKPWADSILGPACRWSADLAPAKVSFSITLDNTSGGVEELFKNPQRFAAFEPITAASQPGAIALPDDGRKQGDCAIAIGLNKGTLLQVILRIGNGPADRADPCPRAVKVAELAIATLKAG